MTLQKKISRSAGTAYTQCKSRKSNVNGHRPRTYVLCDWVWRASGRPHRFLHNNFRSVYRIFTKLGHMIPLWKGKNPIYFGVIRSKVTITINRIFDNRVVSTYIVTNFCSVYWIFTKLDHMISLWKGKNSIYFVVIRSKFKVTYYK